MTGIKENQPIAHIFNEALAEHKDVYWENKNQGKDLDIDFYAYDLGSNKNGFTQIDITDSDINNLIYL
jgi:hypothetical protein